MTLRLEEDYTLTLFDAAGKACSLRILGLDVGTVRIGVAMSDETGLIAQGLTTLHRASWASDLEWLLDSIQTHQIGMVVVGNPLNMNGSSGPQAELVQDFARRLRGVSPVEVVLWDERLSSSSAEKILIEGGMQRGKRRQLIDKLAAVIILQNFLDHRNASQAAWGETSRQND